MLHPDKGVSLFKVVINDCYVFADEQEFSDGKCCWNLGCNYVLFGLEDQSESR